MLSFAVALALTAAPASQPLTGRSATLLASSDAPSLQSSRLLELDREIEAAPTGWPTSTKIIAITGYSVAAAGLIGSIVALAYANGGSMTTMMLALTPALIGGVALIVAVTATIVGAVLASRRAQHRDELLEERAKLLGRVPAHETMAASAPLLTLDI